jgi:FtsP/CotA-like multicopper oxidase with cupredoxin domain/fibronectin type 3 domain-containing protein
MHNRKSLNIMLSALTILSLLLGLARVSNVAAQPASPVDETKVPHYFGPYPNWANSPQTLPDAQVVISGNGTGATAVASVGAGGAITGITVTDPGRGYSNAKIDILGSGTGAAASATIIKKGSIVDIVLNAPGTGYTAPVVSFTGGGSGGGAVATAFGGVEQVTLASGGSGYTFPTVDFDLPDDPAGVQAKGHAEMDVNGTITAVIVDSPGSGYATAPGVSILNGTMFDPIAGATLAAATSTLFIDKIVLDSFGSGYTQVPNVVISDPTGSGALATATLDNGIIASITVTKPGSGYVTPGGIRKFVDTLPGLTPAGANNLGQYLPIAQPDTTTFPNTDYYVIAVVQHREKMHSDLPPTLLREYVQLSTANVPGGQVALQTDLLDGTSVPTLMPDGSQAYAVDNPHYLGPVIVAQKDRAVRIVFYNLLPTGAAGDLFLPVDSTMMGSGMGPMDMMAPMNDGTVMDGIRNPLCTEAPKSDMCFKDNRATLHLHGGTTPWISDGTPHQWITPANEMTAYPQGVSVMEVPDMVGINAPAGVPDCSAPTDGCQTFYYTNQQSARLMFYHDHSWGITRLNVYAGEAAGYMITDATEQALVNSGIIPSDQIPLVIQDRTFVPQASQLAEQDPTWDASRWGSYGNLWYHHVYMPAQNPGDPSGMSAYGRWMYGPWFWPPATPANGPIANPYYDPNCNLDNPATWQYQVDPFCEPAQIPGTPNISAGMEQFNDTPIVNGTAYPTTTLQPKAYRFRILSAANDRFWNLQWYVADSTGTEVALKAAEVDAAQTDPNIFPTPDTALSPVGPSWIQIGTEGGFLPAPVVVPNQPITWITDPTRFDVGNVDKHSLLLAPAERADVIVDFSKYAGKTLILYNDAPAAFPARVPSYDYYTGTASTSVMPGYGPNTRTIMQVKIAASAPAPAFNMSALNAAFKHHADGSGVFESGQHPIIVGQAAYNSAYGTTFASSGYCNSPTRPSAKCDGYARIADQGGNLFKFDTLSGVQVSIPLEPKAIHDEMNSASFDEFGRMTANLGLESVPATPGLQNILLYPYTSSPTEIIDATNLPKGDVNITPIASADGSQIWKITHNGVDTHPIHFHLYDVQVLNRVTWDNIIIPPDASELGWKDTVRISPLEDTIVALRPIVPTLPFDIPNSVRELDPMMPDGAMLAPGLIFNPQGAPTDIVNHLVNFGWEYVYHCHILSHEEMDMMRPVLFAVPPVTPSNLSLDNGTMILSWTDNSLSETAFVIEKSNDGINWTVLGQIDRLLSDVNTTGEVLGFNVGNIGAGDQYRVAALNTVGDTLSIGFPTKTVKSAYAYVEVPTAPAAPTNLTAVLQAGPQVSLAWQDNANNETGFVVERASDGVTFSVIANLGINAASYVDAAVLPGDTYTYQVKAFNSVGDSAYSNQAVVSIPALPADPTNLTATATSGTNVDLAWSDNATNEDGYVIRRSNDGGATWNVVGQTAANGATFSDPSVSPNTAYQYRVHAFNLSGNSLPTNTAQVTTPDAVPAAPSNLTATLQTGPQIALAWTDNANNETGFLLERSVNGGAFSALATVTANTVSYVDTAVSAGSTGNTYVYRVGATNLVGTSAYASSASVLIAATVPARPTGLTVTGIAQTTLVLNWLDNSNNESGFTIQIATNNTFTTGLQTIQVGSNVTSYLFSGLLPNTKYYFRVLAFNVAGSSPWSTIINARTIR